MERLGDVATYINGYAFKPSDWSDTGLPIIRIQDLTGNAYQANRYNGEYASKYEVNDGDVLISWSASLGVYIWHGEKALLNQHIFKVVFDKEEVSKNFFVYQVENILAKAASEAHGATMKHLTKPVFDALPFYLPPIDEQRRIAATLDKVTDLISKRRQQLDKLDELVKARFVEMFGDPVSNPYQWEKVPLSDLADVRIGPFGSLLHKEDYTAGGHPLVNPSHICGNKIIVDEKNSISSSKYAELEPYHLKIGDVVMGRRGEMGRCAVVQCEGMLFGTGSLIIRTKGEVTADYIQKIISFPSFKKTIEDMAVGQTMPNLNVPIVSSFQIIKPPLRIQEDYYKFANQTEKIKTTIGCSLEKLEMLKKALMQEYFGES